MLIETDLADQGGSEGGQQTKPEGGFQPELHPVKQGGVIFFPGKIYKKVR